ncbi:FmdB family zinc ribbon protein [candidate division CSSED10-310 bacterium]|uniref:FmdB family zinc ribbon protein n=1 Tax=candidate division CSSED10-310 bacterium TaxID=2855610 RepID=A0ABV6YXP8_UNCC1
MPIYEFKCRECFHKFEEVQGIKEPPLFFCPRCYGEVERKFFDWDEKLKDYRKYNTQISDAPILPYILLTFMLMLLGFGIFGGIIYRGLIGFLGMMVFTLGVSFISMMGALPVLGPVLYLVWLGPLLKNFMVYDLALAPTALSAFIYWFGFVFALILSIFTTFYTIYRIKTPLLWSFLELSAQEKLKYILLTRLLNYEVSYIWFNPASYSAYLVARLFKIREFPALRLLGDTYYRKEIPVGPIKVIEERRKQLLQKALGGK